MADRLLSMALMCFMVVCAFVAPAWSISFSVSSGDSSRTVYSSENFDLDDITTLHEDLTLGSGSISQYRQASGSGKNTLKQSVAGSGYLLQNNIDSTGSFGVSTSTEAMPQAASISQDASGAGSMSLALQGTDGLLQAGQEASVTYGVMASAQSISAGSGISAYQDTCIVGLQGDAGTGASSQDNVIVATETFLGVGLMQARMSAVAAEGERAKAEGQASLDGVTWLDGTTMQTISEGGRGLSVQGLRGLPDSGLGSVEVNVVNMGFESLGTNSSNAIAVENLNGGSYSSYVLTSKRWNQQNPQIQLYYNSAGQSSNLNADAVKSCIAAAANTWDDAVESNLFADASMVKDATAGTTPYDNNNVHIFGSLPSGILAQTTTYYGGSVVDGYSSIYDSDVVYNTGGTWTTDLQTAVNNNHASPRIFDLQSASLHELGHTIGMGDLYSIDSSGNVHTTDLDQIMDAYDAPQRTLGNGDRTGAQVMYGSSLITLPGDNIGVFSQSTHTFQLGSNSYSGFGISTDLPITGDWNKDGIDEIGVFRSSAGTFFFDNNNNKVWDSGDTAAYFGISTDLPVAGDWNGDEMDEIAVFRPSAGTFFFDYNNNKVWDDGDTTAYFGISIDRPIAGDWSGTGKDTIGVFRPPSRTFFLDYNNDLVWDNGDTSAYFGISEDRPIAGDWGNTGKDAIGVFRPSSRAFYLDYSGDNTWNDGDFAAYFGSSTDLPVAGGWS